MYTTPADQIKLKELTVLGLPCNTCPTADVIPLLLPPKPNADGRWGKSEFVLYDLKNDKVAAKPPLRERKHLLEDFKPRWTADGRYLYYFDRKTSTATTQPAALARIWDRKTGKLAGEVEEGIPIGPGPTKTTMVLRRGGVAKNELRIHDAVSGKTWILITEKPIRPVNVTSKYILYARRTYKEMILYRARIALGK